MCYHILDFIKTKSQFYQKMGDISPFDAGIPLFDCSNKKITEVYYYRWNLFCKHIRKTPEGHVITEFYPEVPWAKKYNTISCPAGHHLYEGRWLHNPQYVKDYATFWFTDEDADPRLYSFWAADAVYNICKVTGDFSLAENLYEGLCKNYEGWENTHLHENSMFWQTDGRDGMEYSVSGAGIRPTINSYMCADAKALSQIALRVGDEQNFKKYSDKYEFLKEKINTVLWDKQAEFFKPLSKNCDYTFPDAREQIGFVPWYFNIPTEEKTVAWKFLNDENYFKAPYGPTTLERNHPRFMEEFDHECLWNGPSWPFATSQTLTALANLLNNYNQSVMTKSDFYNLLDTFAKSQYDGDKPYTDENLDPFTGEWIARKKLREMENPPGGDDRGCDYNHSSFCDIVITGLCGIRPSEGKSLSINPLFREDDLDFLCLDGVQYHGHLITILWDKDGTRYQKGKGLHIYTDGKEVFASDKLAKKPIGVL